MSLSAVKKLATEPALDFRAKATLGVAVAALFLLAPFAISSAWLGHYALSIGTSGIVVVLGANAWIIAQGRCHQALTLFGLVPAGMVFMTQVFLYSGIIGSLWCYPSIVACYCMLSQRRAWIANGMILAIALPMMWSTLEVSMASRIMATMLAVSAFSAILVRVIDEQHRQLRQQVRSDFLTGLDNRLSMMEAVDDALRAHRDRRLSMVLLALDLDHFKTINDSFGHDAGDDVLQAFARLLRESVPECGTAFRVGGEEFFVLLRGRDEDTGAALAESIRRHTFNTLSIGPRRVTVSIGVAGLRNSDVRSSWINRSDRRLYRAKAAGRNTVVAGDNNATSDAPLAPLLAPHPEKG